MNGSITIEHIEYRNIIQRDREQHNTSAQTTQRSAAQYVIDFWLIKIFVLAMEKNVSIDILRRTIPKLRKRTPYPQEQNSILFISSWSADIQVSFRKLKYAILHSFERTEWPRRTSLAMVKHEK